MEKKFVSVVAYMHNAASYLERFLDVVVESCKNNFEQFELVCVEDACEDNTMDILHNYFREKNAGIMVNVIHMSYFQGVESAMNAGRDLAIGDFVYEFDDIWVDYPEEMILNAYYEILKGYDIVAVRNNCRGRFTSRLFYALFNKNRRGIEKIGPETFRIISRRAINRVSSLGKYIPYRKAVYMNCGLKTTTIVYSGINYSKHLKKHAITSERTGLALDSFIYFTNVLEQLSAIISGVFLAVTVGTGIYILVDFFSDAKIVEGWVSIMGFMALGFFGVFMLLTIILKYLSVILGLIFKHQRYLIEDIEKL